MRILTTVAVAMWGMGLAPAFAQTQIAPPATMTTPKRPQLYDTSQFRAPVGHRQPKPAEVTPQQQPAAVDPVEDLAREDALLTRRINGICRGC